MYSRPSEQIPVVAKILAIADTYAAITMHRSYKPPRTHEDAVRIIREVEGTQLDRELAELFLTIPQSRLENCIPEQVKF